MALTLTSPIMPKLVPSQFSYWNLTDPVISVLLIYSVTCCCSEKYLKSFTWPLSFWMMWSLYDSLSLRHFPLYFCYGICPGAFSLPKCPILLPSFYGICTCSLSPLFENVQLLFLPLLISSHSLVFVFKIYFLDNFSHIHIF